MLLGTLLCIGQLTQAMDGLMLSQEAAGNRDNALQVLSMHTLEANYSTWATWLCCLDCAASHERQPGWLAPNAGPLHARSLDQEQLGPQCLMIWSILSPHQQTMG